MLRFAIMIAEMFVRGGDVLGEIINNSGQTRTSVNASYAIRVHPADNPILRCH
jgi:hypothetical protein